MIEFWTQIAEISTIAFRVELVMETISVNIHCRDKIAHRLAITAENKPRISPFS